MSSQPSPLRATLSSFGTLTQSATIILLLTLSTINYLSARKPSPPPPHPQHKNKPPLLLLLLTRSESIRPTLHIAIYLLSLLLYGAIILPRTRGEARTGESAAGNLQSGDMGYIYRTRLPAHLLAALLPFQALLAQRGSLAPLRILVPHISRAKTLSYHRALGWAFLALASVHAGMYLSFYVARGILGRRLRGVDVRFGVACLAVLGFGVVGFAASRRFRVVVGQTAWVWWHLGAVGLLGAGVWGHVVQGRGFVAQAGVVIGLGVAYRGFRGLRGWKAV